MNAARTNTCSKCGAIGFTARTCGRTHNVAGAPPRDVIAKPKTTNPPPYRAGRSDRFARIEAAAAARRTGDHAAARMDG